MCAVLRLTFAGLTALELSDWVGVEVSVKVGEVAKKDDGGSDSSSSSPDPVDVPLSRIPLQAEG